MIIAIWCCVGLLLMVQARLNFDDSEPLRFTAWILAQQVARAAFWAALTPWVLWLGHRWAFSGPDRYWHLTAHLGLAVLLGVIFYALRVPVFFWVMEVPEHQRNLERLVAGLSPRNLVDPLLYFGILFAGKALAAAEKSHDAALREERLLRRLAEAELAALRQQVQPHFLFNAMNTVASLVRNDSPAEAVRMLGRIGALHRRLVECSGRPLCSLAEEIQFARDYLDVERVRFGDRLRVRISLPDDCASLAVPTLLLQPLVENAVKHGISRLRAGGEVAVAARRVGDDLEVIVENDCSDEPGPAPEGTGFGLRHTRERLHRHPDGAGALEVSRESRRHVVRLTLPARPHHEAAATTPDA